MSAELIEDDIRIVLDSIGEGWNGDYNEDDPEDEELLRIDVYLRNIENDPFYDEWTPADSASYCTMFPANTSQDLQDKAVRLIMDRVKDAVEDGRSLKRVCAELSWISPEWVGKDNADG